MKIDIQVLFFITSASCVGSQNIRGTTTGRNLESPCINDAPFDGLDDGCNADFPLCAMSDDYEPAAHVAGDHCGKCHNIWDTDEFVDFGCTADKPSCDAGLGLIGMQCLPAKVIPPPVCRNTGAFGAKDETCTDEAPICYDATSQQEVGSFVGGTGCARCLNSFVNEYHQYGIPDYGCPTDQPRCVMTDGNDPDLNKVGSRCCPAGGCLVTCPCNSPNTFFDFALNDLAVSQVAGWWCEENKEIAYGHITLSDGSWGGFIGGGKPYPDNWYCISWNNAFRYDLREHLTPYKGCACLALVQDFMTETNAKCSPY